jgi:hypothetical protein
MMKTVTPRRVIWKILLFAGGSLLVLLGFAWLWVDSVAVRRRARMEQQIRQLHVETLARVDSRPALYGETLPGNAWSDYSLAIAEVAKMQGEATNLMRMWSDSPNADRSRLKYLIQTHGSFFDHLRRGASGNSGSFPFVWEEGLALKPPVYDDADMLGRFVACTARSLAQEGKVGEAVMRLLDLLQFSRDLCVNSTEACTGRASALWDIAALQLKEIVFSEEYPRQDLSGLDVVLERLDVHFPPAGPIVLNETLRVGFELLKPVHQLQVGRLQHRRYAFSSRIAEADAFEVILAAARKAAPRKDVSAAETRDLGPEWFLPNRPLIQLTSRDIFFSRGFRDFRTILRLLRVAVHYRATGEVLELEDPFGDKLLHCIIGEDLRVWSVGPDGIDHEGDDGGWGWLRTRPTPIPGRAMRVARDIVLQVEK